MKIVSYNVNGIRAALTKGLLQWIRKQNPDVICLQEIKAFPEQVETEAFLEAGYHLYWNPAQKPGYSGVALFSKTEPDNVVIGKGKKGDDPEGRILRADFGDRSIMSVYMPSGTTGDVRQTFKMNWLEAFDDFIADVSAKRKKLVIAGDYNIAHEAIDIHNPISNANSSGFLPEEREWIGNFMKKGYVDAFRHLNKEPHHYSWWSFRANSRANNKGWRIDYEMISKALAGKLKKSYMDPEAKHSDHCPVICVLEK